MPKKPNPNKPIKGERGPERVILPYRPFLTFPSYEAYRAYLDNRKNTKE